MAIYIEQPPEQLDSDTSGYTTRMFESIDEAIERSDALTVRTDFSGKPIEGKLYYFKNASTKTPAITSAGYWGYVGDNVTGAWVKLG